MDITLAGSGITYTPNNDQLTGVSIEFAAFDGEIGNGLLPVPDAAAALEPATGRAVQVNEIGTRLTDGFLLDEDRSRGPEPDGVKRTLQFGLADANALLYGFRVIRNRGSETDRARVLAFAATDLPAFDTTWVLSGSDVTMPAKSYDSDSGWGELISDVVEFTGKTLFVHDKAGGGRCLHYHQLTQGHTCGLSISDVVAAYNGTTVFKPTQPVRTRTSIDLVNSVRGRDQAGRISIATDSASVSAHDADGLRHQALIDFETTSQADLDVKTAAYLASQKDELYTYQVGIGPLDATALANIRVGDLITVTSSVLGLTASAKRIAHMTLTVYGQDPPAPGLWFAQLELGAPIRRRARVKPSLQGVIIPPGTPGGYPPPYTGVGGPCEWESWDTDDDWTELAALHVTPDDNISEGVNGGKFVVSWAAGDGGLNYSRGVDVPRSIIESGMTVSTTFGYSDPLQTVTDGTIQFEVSLSMPGGNTYRRSATAAIRADGGLPALLDEISIRNEAGGTLPISNTTDGSLFDGTGPTDELHIKQMELDPDADHVMVLRSNPPGSSSAIIDGTTVSGTESSPAFNDGHFFDVDGVDYGSVSVRLSIDAAGTLDPHTAWFGGVSILDINGSALAFFCPADPIGGQYVNDEAAPNGDGSTDTGTTNYPFRAGSLRISVNGLDWTPFLVSVVPSTGAYGLSYPPPDDAIVRRSYVAAP